MKITIKDIAKEAGVSTTTVSLVLNDRPNTVSTAVKERIREIAKNLNYTPNSMAVGLVTKKTNTIGLIVPDIQNMFFSELAKYIERFASKNGYSVVLCNTDGKMKEDIKYIQLLSNRGIDGLMVAFSSENNREETDRLLGTLDELTIPYIALDRWIDGLKCGRISVNHIAGGETAVNHLIEMGHKRIACISGPLGTYSARRRLKGYENSLSGNDIKLDSGLVFEGDYTFNGGYECAKEVLKTDATAIFACNDLMAYGAYRAIREKNLKIPEDISIMGFDDLFFSTMLEVPLTSISQNVERLCMEIWDKLYDCMENDKKFVDIIRLEPTLIKRNSVKNLNN